MIRKLFLILSLVVFAVPSSHAAPGKKSNNKGNSDDMWVTFPVPKLPAGVTHHVYRSQSMNRGVGYCIYLPPGYETNQDRRYPVIYELHGAGGNEFRSLYSASVLHDAILAGKTPEIIMVFPNGGRSTMYQDSGDGRFMAETTCRYDGGRKLIQFYNLGKPDKNFENHKVLETMAKDIIDRWLIAKPATT